MNLAEITEFDFDHELKFSSIPFNDMVKKSKHFTALLKAEYLQAPLRPKIYLYLREFISDEAWEASVLESQSRSRVSGSLPVAAPMIMPTETEIRSRELGEVFYQQVIDKTLDEKYFGRNISETPLVGLLKKLDEYLEVFRQYVIEHKDVSQYQAYGHAAAKSLIGLAEKISDAALRAAILREIKAVDIATDIAILIMVNKLPETEQKAIKKRFIILKTFADEIFNSPAPQPTPEILAMMSAKPEAPKITVVDRMLRELDIIYHIFKAQYYVYDRENPNSYPTVLDAAGHSGINGSYIQNLDILSETELLNIQDFKQQMITRYESTTNHQLLNNQLQQIYESAVLCVDYYNQNLTDGNPIVEAFKIDHARPVKERLPEIEKYHAVVVIGSYQIYEIYFGTNCSELYAMEGFHSREPYRYIAGNHFLADIAQQILSFVEQFDIGSKVKNKEKVQSGLSPENLFRNPGAASLYLDVLKNVEPSIINDQGHFNLGGHEKSAVIAWFDLLKAANKITPGLTPAQQTDLVNALIPDLNVSKRLFSNMGQRAYESYRPELERLIKRL